MSNGRLLGLGGGYTTGANRLGLGGSMRVAMAFAARMGFCAILAFATGMGFRTVLTGTAGRIGGFLASAAGLARGGAFDLHGIGLGRLGSIGRGGHFLRSGGGLYKGGALGTGTGQKGDSGKGGKEDTHGSVSLFVPES